MQQSLLSESVVRSLPLSTHLDSDANAPLPSDFDVEKFLTDWCDVFDSEEAFRERLTLSGYTVERLHEQFERVPQDERATTPTAFETAEAVVSRAVDETSDEELKRALASRYEQSPFVDLVAPLAAAGVEGWDFENDYSHSAFDSLVDWLFERLTTAFQHPLFILFKAYQQTEYPDTDFERQTGSTAVYDEFVERYGEYGPIFETYPVLLELLDTIVDQWHVAVHRLDERLSADSERLAAKFNDDEALGIVADVTPLSDDPHGDGEIVWRLDFEADCSVVYKPRSVGGERAFTDVLDWTNANTDVPDLYVPDVLGREEYGWMEFLNHTDCDSVEAVERYFERMGALSALAFVLGSTDLHQDNIVAAGDQPIIVDQETALSPQFDTPSAPSSPALSSLVEGSILETVLVPFTSEVNEGDSQTVTNSGLAKLDDVEYERKSPTFSRVNTDAMEMSFRDKRRVDGSNLPRLDGKIQSAPDHVEDLKTGFRDVVEAIASDREEFLADDGPLRAFEGCEVRYLLRPTGHYSSKLTESAYSSQLRSGLQRSLALESLYRIFVPENDDDLWKCVEAEKETLRRFTIPRFTVEADGHELRDGHGEPQGVFVDQSPLDHARERVAHLDDHWIETQLRLLDLAFTSSMVSGPVAEPSSDRSGSSVSDAEDPSEVVSNVVSHFEALATEYPDGSDRWAELARSSPDDAFLLQEPKLNLYEGYAGVGLFFGAAAAVRDDDELAAKSKRVLKPIQTAFEEGNTDHLRIGGTNGKGSVAYGLVTAGDLLGDKELLEDGRAIADQTTREEIESDTGLDVIGGAAGELLAQLAVYERAGDEDALERARWCGDRLLEATTETADGYRIPTNEDDARFAFAHGVGGIGTALVKLSAATGEEEYARVGEDALQFDAELWQRETDPECENSFENESGTIWGWCNGAVGVGLGHVAVADTEGYESPSSVSMPRDDLQAELSLEDSVCCGSAGRALVILDAGQTFDDPDLLERGETLFEEMLERAEEEGRLRLGNHLPMLPRFGLFTGLAGVGYVALKLEAREKDIDVPNVARLE